VDPREWEQVLRELDAIGGAVVGFSGIGRAAISQNI
jgi:hypothetical protein